MIRWITGACVHTLVIARHLMGANLLKLSRPGEVHFVRYFLSVLSIVLEWLDKWVVRFWVNLGFFLSVFVHVLEWLDKWVLGFLSHFRFLSLLVID